jgi:hypothetical protein
MTFTDDEIRSMIPAMFWEVCSLTRSERHQELRPAGQSKVERLRDILKRMIAQTGWELSEQERALAGLNS